MRRYPGPQVPELLVGGTDREETGVFAAPAEELDSNVGGPRTAGIDL
jgi:hypothetical protein